MRTANVYFKNSLAGVLTEQDTELYIFRYTDQWFHDLSKPSISLTLPKSVIEFRSPVLFPFFFNMIPEGGNKQRLCVKKRIDANDYFGILLEVAGGDNIGAVRVVKQ